MVTRLWHHFAIMAAPAFWSFFRRMPRLLAWLAHVIPEIRLVHRQGKLRGDDTAQEYLEAQLLPLDIIIDRGPPKLSDKFVPGYFKHAAVYLGPELTQEVIKTASASGLPSPVRGHLPTILEATRHGVSLVSLREFLDADSLVVLRPERVSSEEKKRVVSRSVCELGKEYDYTFTLANNQKQFCCKLVYSLFPDLPIADVFNTGTAMVPDDFVQPTLFQQSPARHLALLIYDGQLIRTDQQVEVLAQLLRDGCRQTAHGIKTLSRRNLAGDAISGRLSSETIHQGRIRPPDKAASSAN